MHSNTEKFREAALHFQEFNTYTRLPYGSTSWIKFWKEESNRCLNGFKSEDGTWISGYFYDYLNYSPIMISEAVEGATTEGDGQIQANRIQEFAKFYDGDFDFFMYLDEAEKKGEHALLYGSRGKGKSFKAGAMMCRNYFHIPNSVSFAFAAHEQYLTGDGIISKAWNIMDFRDQHTPWGKRRQFKNTDMHRRASIQADINGIKVEQGFKSEIMGVTVGDDIQKLRGKRGKLIILEEFGNFRKGTTGWNILRPSMEDGRNTFGLILAMGTGGTEGDNSQAIEELFTKPKAYRIHAVTNKWDEGLEGTECAYFWPAYINYPGAMDKDGNSIIHKAKELILSDRKLVAEAGDPHAVTRRAAELPLTPREAMMRISGTQFPIRDLRQLEGEIETQPHKYRDADYKGYFILDKENQKYKFIYDASANPILSFPHKDNKNMAGSVVIYEHPVEGTENMGLGYRYIAGCDSYDFDESTTTSLGSLFVLDLFTKRIVAEYTGRPKAFDFYETARRLLLYYNARVNIENFNKGIFDYFDSKACGYLICEELRISREAVQEPNNIRKRGTTPSPKLNEFCRALIAKWLLDSTDNPEKPEEIQLHRFRCLPAVKELIHWNIDGNFDRVSALGMLMLYLNDKERYSIEATTTLNNLAKDDFFTRQFKI